MCDMCESPLKWRIEDDSKGQPVLLVPVEKSYDITPEVEGWKPYWVNVDLNSDDGYEKIVKYKQPVTMFFICAYREEHCYGGPEEGGWGYCRRELIGAVMRSYGERELAEHSCRSLNRLARENNVAPGPYNWGTTGVVFSVDHYPGEHDTSKDPRPHYC
jgi:hypothetical protein